MRSPTCLIRHNTSFSPFRLLPSLPSNNRCRRRRSSWLSKTTTASLLLLSSSSSSSSSTTFVRAFASSWFGMSSSNTQRTPDGTITVTPKDEASQSALIVIAHGLGDTAEGFADVADFLSREMPYCKFVLPTAPTQPVTMNMGMSMPAWYDITGLDERSNEDCKGIDQSVERLRNILQTEYETVKLPYNRMVLAGFSQGGALSLFTGLQLDHSEENPKKLAGLVVMSGYLPASKKFKVTPGLESTPVLHCHGTQDMVVQHPMAQKSANHIQELGVAQYTFKSYPVAHTVSMDELQDVLAFLKEILPDDPNCRVTLPDPATMTIKELKAAIRKAGLTNQARGFMEKQEFVKLLQDHRGGKL